MKPESRKKPKYSGIALTIVIMVLLYVLLNKNGYISKTGTDLSYLILPSLSLLGGMLASQIVPLIFTGSLVELLCSSMQLLGLGLGLYFLLGKSPIPMSYRPMRNYVLLLTAATIAFRFLLIMLKNHGVIKILCKSLFIFSMGFILKSIFSTLMPQGLHMSSPPVSFPLGDISLIFFSLLGICSLFSLLSLSKNTRTALAGKWFEGFLGPGSMLMAAAVFYFVSVREYIRTLKYFHTIEWILLMGACTFLAAGLSIKIKDMKKLPVSTGWGKHHLEIEEKPSDELESISKYMEEFIESGSKNNLLIYIIGETINLKLPADAVSSIISGLVDYKDRSSPLLSLRLGSRLVDKVNGEHRARVLEDLINKLKTYREVKKCTAASQEINAVK